MDSNVIAHLRTLFPRLNRVDFSRIETIGQTSISLMIEHLGIPIKTLKEQIDKQKGLLHAACASQNPDGDKDIMNVSEVSTELALLQMRLGHRKIVVSNLKTVLGNLKREKGDKNLPALPVLREYGHFNTGDDVMVYVGLTEDNKWYNSTEESIRACDWVSGKVLDTGKRGDAAVMVSVFCNHKTFEMSNLEGHVGTFPATMPIIFKRDEFFSIRFLLSSLQQGPSTKIMIESRYGSTQEDLIEFKKIFLKSCEKRAKEYGRLERWGDVLAIERMIRYKDIERFSDDELKVQTPNIIERIVSLTKKHDMFVSQAEKLRELVQK